MLPLKIKIAFYLILLIMLPAQAFAYTSDGSDGIFNPENSILLDLPEDGVFNFTSIFIDSDITITFNPDTVNHHIYFLAAENIIIKGTIDISNFSNGDGGGMTLSTPETLQIEGSLLANGNSSGGNGGNIDLRSGMMITISNNAYLSCLGYTDVPLGGIRSYGTITLSKESDNVLTGSSIYLGVVDSGITYVPGEIAISSVPVPSTVFLLVSGMIGLAGFKCW